MKTKINYLILLAVVIFSSCSDNGKVAEVEKIKRERDSVIKLERFSDSTVTDFINYMAEIENGLINIKRKENVLAIGSEGSVEMNKNSRENINRDIQEINDLMEKNRQSIEELNKKLKRSQFNNSKLNKMIAVLNEQLLEKNNDLERLNAELVARNATIDQLNTSLTTLIEHNNMKSDTISRQHAKMNEAFYIVGNYKELRDKNIVDKKGGFLGLGKEKSLKTDFDPSSFTQVNIERTTTLPVAGKNVKVITNHPGNSYKLERDGKKTVTGMVITDPENFWRTSKYLVVLVD